MSKCKNCHCDCHCDEDLHTHHFDNDICTCDKCKCNNKRTYEKLKDHGLDISFENEAKYG
jgi:hypothetical protein